MRRRAGAHDLALGVGQGGVALDVGVLVDRRRERDQATVAEEEDHDEDDRNDQPEAQRLLRTKNARAHAAAGWCHLPKLLQNGVQQSYCSN